MSEKEKNAYASEVNRILLEVSNDIISKKEEGVFFSVNNDESENEYKENFQYKKDELAEFINFDMLGEENDDVKPFSHLTVDNNYEDITNDGGVLKLVLNPGAGQVVPIDSIVLVHYTGYISNLHEPFDVTYLQGKRPKRFKLGNCELLLGLEIGILTMKHGENARFIISPEYAYKKMGCPPRIPPNATVLFDVHLVSYFTSGEDDYGNKSFVKNIKLVEQLHLEGNECFKKKTIESAIVKYEKAVEILHITGYQNDQEEIDLFKHLNKLYSNLSICYLKIFAFNKVCYVCLEAMKYSERFSKYNAKLWFNWGKALRFLKDFTEGKKKLQRALHFESQNLTIQYELQRLEKDKELQHRIDSIVTFKNDTVEDDKRLPPAFWEIFNTIIKQFIDSSDDVLTVILNNNCDDIELAERKANLNNLQFQSLKNHNIKTNYCVIKK